MDSAAVQFNRTPLKILEGKPSFIPDPQYAEFQADLRHGFINRLKTALKNFRWLYAFIFYVLAPALFLGKRPEALYELVPPGGLVIEIGSGNRRLRRGTINVDIHPWEQVDILADAHDLPFADGTVDGVIFSWVLEHIRDPVRVAAELRRILKKGGYLYVATNFITPYHPSPQDYYRWTADGLKELFSDFEITELRPTLGPTCAMLSVLQEWAALALSFNNGLLKDLLWIAMVILTSPLKLLDFVLIRYRDAEKISAGFYLIGRKR